MSPPCPAEGPTDGFPLRSGKPNLAHVLLAKTGVLAEQESELPGLTRTDTGDARLLLWGFSTVTWDAQ